jgi:hypothetical protein
VKRLEFETWPRKLQGCLSRSLPRLERAYSDAGKVSAVLANFENAPIEEPLRATMRMISKRFRLVESTRRLHQHAAREAASQFQSRTDGISKGKNAGSINQIAV